MITTDWWIEEAPLDIPFTISRGTTTVAALPIVELHSDDGAVGYGAAGPSRYYGETADTVATLLPELLAVVEEADDPFAIDAIHRELDNVVGDNPAAKAAVDIALYDLAAKRLDVPVATLLGHETEVGIQSSYTIGIDQPAVMADRAGEAVEAGHEVLKVKLGGGSDAEAIRSVRAAAPDATIRVDANEAWTPAQALELIDHCADADVEFVEQPLPANDQHGLKRVYEQSPLPIAADESSVVASDIPRVADRCDIVNLKLMKCGGITGALKFIHTARAHHKEIMLGCMVESTASIAAGAHLAPLVDYVDLDGALLLAADPFVGDHVRPGAIELDPAEAGLGVTRADG